MADYKEALQAGFAAAKKAEIARKEVEEILGKFKADLLAASDGKLLVEIREFEEDESHYERMVRTSMVFGSPPQPKKTFKVLIATNPKATKPVISQLAVWKQAKDGYPCSLIWNKQERQCEDGVALEEGLAELLKDPRVGERLYSLMQQK
jgi:hypothetical protein